MKKSKIAIIIIAVVALITLGSSIEVVNQDEFKLVKRFGKVDRLRPEYVLRFRLWRLRTHFLRKYYYMT